MRLAGIELSVIESPTETDITAIRADTNGLTLGRGVSDDRPSFIPRAVPHCQLDANPFMSRTHCYIKSIGEGFWVVDLSQNGTMVDGSAVDPNAPNGFGLANGSTVTLAGWSFKASIVYQPEAERPAPPLSAGWQDPSGGSDRVPLRNPPRAPSNDPFAVDGGSESDPNADAAPAVQSAEDDIWWDGDAPLAAAESGAMPETESAATGSTRDGGLQDTPVIASPPPAPAGPSQFHSLVNATGLDEQADEMGLSTESAIALGKVVRALLSAHLDLLATRASLNQALKRPETVIQLSDDAALKSAVKHRDREAAVDQLLRQILGGEIDAGHIASTANQVGGRIHALFHAAEEATGQILEELNPETIESDIGLAFSKGAAAWDIYQQKYANLRDAWSADFNRQFGEVLRRVEKAPPDRNPSNT